MKLSIDNLNKHDNPKAFGGFISSEDSYGNQLWEFPVPGETQWVVAARQAEEDGSFTWTVGMAVLAGWFVNDNPEDYVNHRVEDV